MNFIKELLYRLRGDFTTEKLISMGMTVGKGFKRLHGVILDPGHCWLITIGDNVTMAPPGPHPLPRCQHQAVSELHQNRQSHHR